jgi:hypothetical protein
MSGYKDGERIPAHRRVGTVERNFERRAGRTTRLGQPQQDAALRYMDDAERNLRKLRKALKKGNASLSAEWLTAVQSDAARVATVLAFAGADKRERESQD